MMRLRRALAPIAAVWLLYQVSMFASAPVVFWVGSAEELLDCTCSHGENAMCPMHHKPAPGSTICLMRSADDSGTAALTSLFGAAGLLPAVTRIAAPAPTHIVVHCEPTAPSVRPAPPEPPPPRA